jgi:peptide/nickel transport system substrate-binding protein
MFAMLVPLASVSGAGIPNPDHIFFASIGMPETVDPHWAYDTASGELIQNVYEPLCIFNATDTASFLPALADNWPGLGVSPGNAIIPSPPAIEGAAETWYFHIRTGVKWHDPKYGTVTPEDVEYSFERGMLFDHTAGPMWMLYEPLLYAESSYDWDVDGDGTLSKAEYDELAVAIDNAIESNSTHVWFNLAQSYAPFQQILSQTWSVVMCRQWCIDHGLWDKRIAETYGWTSTQAYQEFLRTWDPPEPGPLMEQPDAPGPVVPGPVMMGTGPYKLAAMNPDPHTGFWTLVKFDDYWRGWPAPGYMYTDGVAASGFATYVTYKNVEEWANRKAQFFSTDPALQVDLCAVPRANCPELHVNSDKDGPTLPGFRLMFLTIPALDALYFTFTVNPDTPYPPKIGTEVKLNIMSDRYLRLAFIYCFNFTKFLKDVYLGEAIQPPVCMPPGTAFYNASKPKYAIDLEKATEYFKKAWGGRIWSEGMTVSFAYNIGNVARQTIAEMFEYYVENFIPWPSGVRVDIQPQAVPWATYLPGMKNRMYTTFTVGWLADFPDPHNWFQPFMHPKGTYCGRQNVTYGLDLASLTENWYAGATYHPPPYTNALGETVTAINNTYIAHMIDVGVGQPPEIRHMIYEELMDIYHAEATQLPLDVAIGRHYERTWIHGYDKTFNMNPIAPGPYFYTMWKAPAGTLFEVDISAVESITNVSIAYPIIQVYYGEMRLNGKPAMINYTIHVAYKTGTVDVWVYIGLLRNSTEGKWYFPLDYYISLSPGEDYTATITWYEEDTMTEGTWTISLYVSPSGVPGGEVVDPNTGNNKADHPQKVTTKEWPIDIDGSGIIDIRDVAGAAKAFDSVPGHPRWNPDADVDKNGIVDIRDIAKIAKMFGTKFTDVFA